MPSSSQVPLYVRLSAEPSQRLNRAVEVSGKSKRQIVEDAVREHLDDRGVELGRITLRELPPEVLTLDEAAVLLRVGTADLEAAASAGAVPARRIGNEWRFTRVALLAWLGQSSEPVR